MSVKNQRIDKFKGLNNVSDPLRLGLGWLSRADNVDITDTGALVRRGGYALYRSGVLSGAFNTADFKRLYVVDGGALKRIDSASSAITLRTGLSNKQMHWVEVNNDVYFTNGIDSGIIRRDDSVIDWAWSVPTPVVLSAGQGDLPAGQYQVACTYRMPDGRETGASAVSIIDLAAGSSLVISSIPSVAGYVTRVYVAPANSRVLQLAFETTQASASWNATPDALGEELMYGVIFPLPLGATQPTLWKGALYVMEYFPESNITVVWCSEPLGFHLFDQRAKFIVLKGKGVMLASHVNALLLGTDDAVYSWDGEKLTVEAEYGAVPGWGSVVDDDNGDVYFWTERGVCRAMPFANVTERQVSVAPGTQAGAAIVRQQGQKKYVVVLRRGGEAFNQHS